MNTATSHPDDDYLRRLIASGLITKERLTQALKDFKQQQGSKPQMKALQQFLVDSNLITAWQNQKLLEGKFRGFLLGKYKLLGHIGTGEKTSVYLAEHTEMRRRVAIKVLPADLVQDEACVRQLYEVVRATAALDHPNIVHTYDADNEGLIHYLVMEFVDGLDLETFVGKFGPLAPASAAMFFRQAADALSHAHDHGFAHRSIDPTKLLLDKSGVTKILDLGMGSLPIEGQRQEAATDPRGDVYSLGCALAFALAGPSSLPARSLAERRHGISPDLAAICEKMTARQPEDRYQTCGEVRDALADWLANQAGG